MPERHVLARLACHVALCTVLAVAASGCGPTLMTANPTSLADADTPALRDLAVDAPLGVWDLSDKRFDGDHAVRLDSEGFGGGSWAVELSVSAPARGTLFSYATRAQSDAVQLELDIERRLVITIGGKRVTTLAEVPADADATQVALSWRASDGRAELVVDGALEWSDRIAPGRGLAHDGVVVVGAAQDAPGSAVDPVFVGGVDEVVLHSRAVPAGVFKNRRLVQQGARPPRTPSRTQPLGLVDQLGHTKFVGTVDISPDGTLVLTSSPERTMLWTLDAQHLLRTFGCGLPARFDPTGRLVACWSEPRTGDGDSDGAAEAAWEARLHVFEAATGRELLRHELGDEPANLDFIDPHTVLVSFRGYGASDDAPSGPVAFELDWSDSVMTVAEHPLKSLDRVELTAIGGRRTIAGVGDDGLRVYRLDEDLEVHQTAVHREDMDYMDAAAIDPSGRWFVGGSYDTPLAVHQIDSGEKVSDVQLVEARRAHSLAWTADGRVAAGAEGETASIWDPIDEMTDAVVRQVGIWEHGGTVRILDVDVSSDGATMVTTVGGRGARVWDTRSELPLGDLGVDVDVAAMDRTGDVEFSPDGRYLLVVDSRPGGEVQVWDVKRGRLERMFGEHSGCVDVLDDHRVRVGAGIHDMGSWMELWDYRTGQKLKSRVPVKRCKTYDREPTSPDGRLRASHDEGLITIERLDEAGDGARVHLRAHDDAWVAYTDDGYFGASNNGARLLMAVRGLETASLDEIALQANRPDIVMERLGGTLPPLRGLSPRVLRRVKTALVLAGIQARDVIGDHQRDLAAHARYVERYETRLRRGPDDDGEATALRAQVGTGGVVDARGRLPVDITLWNAAAFQIYVDGVPAFAEPEPVPSAKSDMAVLRHEVQLTPGRNKVEVSAFDEAGRESQRALLYESFAVAPATRRNQLAGDDGAVGPAGRYALVATDDWDADVTEMRLHDLDTDKVLAQWRVEGHANPIALTADAELALVELRDEERTWEVYEPKSGEHISTWSNKPDAYNPTGLPGTGGRVMVYIYGSRGTEIWDLRTMSRVVEIPENQIGAVTDDGKLGVVTTEDDDGARVARIISLEDGTEVERVSLPDDTLFGTRISGDGRWLAWVDAEGIHTLDRQTGERGPFIEGQYDDFVLQEYGVSIVLEDGFVGAARPIENYGLMVRMHDIESGEHAFDLPAADVIFAAVNTSRELGYSDGGTMDVIDMDESMRAARANAERRRVLEPTLYFVGFGVSDYADDDIPDLGYADQDVRDLADRFESLDAAFADVQIHTWTDDEVTPAAVDQARDILAGAKTTDVVVVFVAGHGLQVRDAEGEWRYHYLVHETELDDVPGTAIELADIEALANATPARQRLFLVDTCESGEADVLGTRGVYAAAESRGMRARAIRGVKLGEVIELKPDTSSAGAMATDVRPERDRFIERDLRRLTGAIVFTSSTGKEASYESEKIENGFFTEALLEALADPRSDLDGDGLVEVSELRRVVPRMVGEATEGLQHPTVDRDNLELEIGFPLP